MAWIEFSLELWDHWKIDRLKDKLGVDYAKALGHISLLWIWAGKYAQNGNLKRFTNDEIDRAARWLGAKNLLKSALQDSALLDASGKLHDWSKHGIRLLLSNRKRVSRYREKYGEKKHYGNVTEMAPKRSTNLTLPNHTQPNLTVPNPTKEKAIWGIEIPDTLKDNGPEIMDWLAYKRERGETYKPMGLNAFWRHLESISPGKRKEAIAYAMAAGYKGVFEPKGGNNAGTTQSGVAHEPDKFAGDDIYKPRNKSEPGT